MNVIAMPAGSSHAVGFRSILVATDASSDAHVALTAATDLAKRSGAQLHLVNAYSLPPSAVYAYAAYVSPDEPTDPFEEGARAVLAKEQARIESLGGRVSGLHTGMGPIYDVIDRVADEVDADIVVVGSRDIGGLHRLLAGSVSTSVLHTTHRPVLIVRGGESWPPAQVIVGVDRSPASKRAALIAASIGRLYPDADVELVEVLPDPLAPTAHYFDLGDELADEHEHLDALAESMEPVAGRSVSATTAFGDAADALLARGDGQTGPNLVVVGTRGLGGVRRLFLGSVSTRILHSGHTPLLVVPAVMDDSVETSSESR